MALKILSCDGGGIRGLITALLIQDLDKDFGFISKTDGFVGTSIGGIIALALAQNVSIEDIIEIFEKKGKRFLRVTGIAGATCGASTRMTA